MPPHVLIVEDDATTRQAIALTLNAEGYTTAEAANGREALGRLRAYGPHCLALLDLSMPVMDGFEFLDARKGDPDLACTPVILVTAVGHIHPAAVRALGADGALQKPFSPEQLLEAVRPYVAPGAP